MVLNHTPDVIAHLDLVKKFNRNTKFFSEKEKWYTAEVEKTIEIISKTNAIVEINTRGFYRNLTTEFYPSNYILNLCRELNVPLMINTDTHHSLELTLGKSEAIDLLKQLKFKSVKILFDNKWQDLEI
jgi:histidinol-phosphatase (PHP family)